MKLGRYRLLPVLVGIVACTANPGLAGRKNHPDPSSTDQRKRALHTLNRLTFGPRPGDVDQVLAIGVDNWIEQQLHPDKINDSAAESRVSGFQTLRMAPAQLLEQFPERQYIKEVLDGKRPMPSSPDVRAIYQVQIARYEMRDEPKPDDADTSLDSLLALPPDRRYQQLLGLASTDARDLAVKLRGKHLQQALDGMSGGPRETVIAMANPQRVPEEELVQAKLLRAIYSQRQLEEVMTDFWFNHFNVFLPKGADRYFVSSYERDVIRPRAFGKFEDLLVATAKSPAMLFYLDNWLSEGPDSPKALGIPDHARRRMPPIPNNKRKRGDGLNENYAREIMELHTLGVDGGYTQQDVTELAKVLTGWTIDKPNQGGGFKFDARMHQPGTKSVLGHRIKDKGEKEGMEMLHLLATNPHTAHFISLKLAQRFVSDNPPDSLVASMSKTFLKKKGDIREVLTTMFRSPEFWADDAYRARVKTPFEFIVSSVRATSAEVSDAAPLVGQLNNMGMPLYLMQPPTGYSVKADKWVSSSALLARMNYSLALAGNKIRGVQVDAAALAGSSPSGTLEQSLAALELGLLAGDVSSATHNSIMGRLSDPMISQRKLDDAARKPNISAIAGLLLGSPDFQRK
jgi:uncharacterized protein (DUF1800 family)